MSDAFSFSGDETVASACRRFLESVFIFAGQEEHAAAALGAFDLQAASWGNLRCGDPPPITRSSFVGVPLECSLAIDAGRVEVRWTAEVLGAAPMQTAYRAASLEHLAALGRASARARALGALLANGPQDYQLLFGVVSGPGGTLSHKLYLHGWHLRRAQRFEWAAFLRELGAAGLADTVDAARAPYEEIYCIGIDLEDETSPRTKLYVQFPPKRAHEAIARYQAVAERGSAESLERFRSQALGGFEQLAASEVLHLTSRRGAEPGLEHLNLFLPTLAHEVAPFSQDATTMPGSDRFFQQRVHAVLEHAGLSAEAYDRVVDGLTIVPPEHSFYFHTHVSYQERATGSPRVTVYFAPQIYADRMESVVHAPMLG